MNSCSWNETHRGMTKGVTSSTPVPALMTNIHIYTLTYTHAIFDQYSAVLLPACFAEGVLTWQCQQGVSPHYL